MKGNSREITTSQQGLHERLDEVVQRHLRHPFRKPFAEHTQVAFDETNRWVKERSAPLILDSCCGVGESAYHLAKRYPESSIVAVDRSAVRLGKHPAHFQEQPENLLLVRADLVDFWRLAEAAGWQLQKHFLLYPNPYPKPSHLQRRWYASPVFSSLLALGGELCVRSNWKIYIDECVRALEIAGYGSQTEPYLCDEAMTAFERKYWVSGQHTWQCTAHL